MEKKTINVIFILFIVVAAYMLIGYEAEPECVFPSDCEILPHADCLSDWLCIDNKCSWDCNMSPTVTTLAAQPNPASAYCIDMGYDLEFRVDSDGNQYGVCVFSPGFECEEWGYFEGECVNYEVSPCSDVANMSSWGNISLYGGVDQIRIEQNLSYVCCANLSVTAERTGRSIILYEENIGEMCRCICGYSLNITVPGLEPGMYSVEIHGVAFEAIEGELLYNGSVEVSL